MHILQPGYNFDPIRKHLHPKSLLVVSYGRVNVSLVSFMLISAYLKDELFFVGIESNFLGL